MSNKARITSVNVVNNQAFVPYMRVNGFVAGKPFQAILHQKILADDLIDLTWYHIKVQGPKHAAMVVNFLNGDRVWRRVRRAAYSAQWNYRITWNRRVKAQFSMPEFDWSKVTITW